MSDKKRTVAGLQREIDRLQARIGALESKLDGQAVIIREHIYGVVDAEMKIKQAMSILRGDDQ